MLDNISTPLFKTLHFSASYQHNRLHSVDLDLLDTNIYSHSYAVSLQHSLEILVTFCLDK